MILVLRNIQCLVICCVCSQITFLALSSCLSQLSSRIPNSWKEKMKIFVFASPEKLDFPLHDNPKAWQGWSHRFPVITDIRSTPYFHSQPAPNAPQSASSSHTCLVSVYYLISPTRCSAFDRCMISQLRAIQMPQVCVGPNCFSCISFKNKGPPPLVSLSACHFALM